MIRRITGRLRELEGWRWRLIRMAPAMLIDHLFELLIAAVALVFGTAQLVGFSTSVLATLMPPIVVTINAAVLVLAGSTIVFGLLRRRYGTIVPLGLRLLGFTCLGYTIALIGLVGPRQALFTVLFLVVATMLSFWKGFLLRSTFLFVEVTTKRGGP